MKEGIKITIEATIDEELIEKLQHGGKLYIFTEKPVDGCEATDDQFEEDDDSQGNEKYVHSHHFAKKLLLIVCGIVAALVVAHILIANVYLPNKARETLDHYVQTFAEEGAKAVSSDDLEDFREAYKKIRIYPDSYRAWKFWDRFYSLKAIVEAEKTATDAEFSDEYKEYRHDYIDRYLVDDGMDFTAKLKKVTSLAKKVHDLEEH